MSAAPRLWVGRRWAPRLWVGRRWAPRLWVGTRWEPILGCISKFDGIKVSGINGLTVNSFVRLEEQTSHGNKSLLSIITLIAPSNKENKSLLSIITLIAPSNKENKSLLSIITLIALCNKGNKSLVSIITLIAPSNKGWSLFTRAKWLWICFSGIFISTVNGSFAPNGVNHRPYQNTFCYMGQLKLWGGQW